MPTGQLMAKQEVERKVALQGHNGENIDIRLDC